MKPERENEEKYSAHIIQIVIYGRCILKCIALGCCFTGGQCRLPRVGAPPPGEGRGQ